MAQYRVIVNRRAVLTGPELRHVQDYSSLHFDLWRIVQYLDLRDRLPVNDDGRDLFTRAALWEAAVITYGRLFSKGMRTQLDGWVKQLSRPERDQHDQVIAMRNLDIAHYLKRTALSSIIAVEFDETDQPLGLVVEHYPFMEPTPEPDLRTLVVDLGAHVDAKLDQLAARAVEQLDIGACLATAVKGPLPQPEHRTRVRQTYTSWGVES